MIDVCLPISSKKIEMVFADRPQFGYFSEIKLVLYSVRISSFFMSSFKTLSEAIV